MYTVLITLHKSALNDVFHQHDVEEGNQGVLVVTLHKRRRSEGSGCHLTFNRLLRKTRLYTGSVL